MTEETFNPDNSAFNELFAQAGWQDIAKAPVNEKRVKEVTQRALSETILKESSSFFFLGFTSAISGVFAAFFGGIRDNEEDYKP